ncbi:MAG: hypothetical protein C4586_00365 [Anaerolineaceae bacterium]|nr:MAG: hypothetical protein C4586_00365 [Anaerolineaceae bacterium]
MTITRQAYAKHDFIRTSIDLLCAGVSWRGGKFIAHNSNLQAKILPTTDDAFLEQVAKSMLLDGQAFIEVSNAEGKLGITQITAPAASKVGIIITIERVESSFSPKAEPILERVGSHIELYEKAHEQLATNSVAVELLSYALPAIHTALAIPSSMLDQSRFAQMPVEALMMGAIQYQSEVRQLRHNLRFGMNQVGNLVGEKLEIDYVSWEWNDEWITEGPCKYGHVYQIFQLKGINLTPIMNSELGGMKLAVQAGLISNRTYAECAESYGVK